MPTETAIEELGNFMKKMKELVELATKYNNYEKTLDMEVTAFEELDSLKSDITNKYDMWLSSRDWKILVSGWMTS